LASTYGQSNLDGIYLGLEPMCWTLKSGKKDCYTDPLSPKRKWYHLTYLKIQGDTIFADQSPVHIYKKDTLYSSSDGAFFYYHGHVDQNDTTADIKMQLIFCDYCGMPEEGSPNAYLFPSTKNYFAKIIDQGILINEYLFIKTDKKEKLINEHPDPYIHTQ
jgi:hypothetical protein